MTRIPLRALVALSTLALVACEIQTTNGSRSNAPPPGYGPPPYGPPPPGAPPPGAPPTAPPPAAPAAGGGIAPGACAPGSVCFNIVPKAAGPIGPTRLVLFWSPPGDDEKVPPEIYPLANLQGNERSVVLPMSAIRPPRTTIRMGQAWGYVFAVAASDPANNPKSAVGVPSMMFVHVVGAQAQAPYMKSKFPAGMAEGTAPYFMQKGQGSHDNFLLAAPRSVFELSMCPTNAPNCDLDFPNPS